MTKKLFKKLVWLMFEVSLIIVSFMIFLYAIHIRDKNSIIEGIILSIIIVKIFIFNVISIYKNLEQ